MPTPQIGSLDAASELFNTEVTTKYQNSEKLRDTIEERHGTNGTTLNVPVSDEIEMNQSNFAPTDIQITPVEETNVPVITKDYNLKTVIGGGEETLFNYDKIVTHARLHAKAAGRMNDFVKLNAIYSDPALLASLYTVPITVGVNTGINQGKMSDALSYLEAQGFDDMEMYDISMWAPAQLKKSMQDDDRIVNFFYNDVKPLTNNRIQTYLDVDCRFVGENGINRIPSDGGVPTNQYLVPLVHKYAIVQSFNRDVKTTITWVAQQDRWELLTTFTTGSNVIQSNGIAMMQVNDPFAQN